MPRIRILPGLAKVSKSGFDPRTATFDNLLIDTSYVSDQAVLYGDVAFGSGNSVSVPLPSGRANWKVDFFYCAYASGTPSGYLTPDSMTMSMDAAGRFVQLNARFSGGNVIFERRGNIAGQADRGVWFYLYSSALG